MGQTDTDVLSELVRLVNLERVLNNQLEIVRREIAKLTVELTDNVNENARATDVFAREITLNGKPTLLVCRSDKKRVYVVPYNCQEQTYYFEFS